MSCSEKGKDEWQGLLRQKPSEMAGFERLHSTRRQDSLSNPKRRCKQAIVRPQGAYGFLLERTQ